jgi:predicted transcriptional regulator YdeE
MNKETVQLEEFAIVGIAIRTTNRHGQSQKDIGGLWGRYFRENICSLIPEKTNADLYGVYMEYETDHTGYYTALLGHRVAAGSTAPEGMLYKVIPASDYLVFSSEGKQPEAIGQTWAHIWQSDYPRRFAADFDVYGPEVQVQDMGTVKTYLSVK